MSTPLDPDAVPDHLAARFLQVEEMVEALQAPDPPEFFVALTRYFIEGEAYGTSGLTVSATGTPGLVQTQSGFVCNAFFPPDLLTADAPRGKQEQAAGVTVRHEAELDDIIEIVAIPPSGAQPAR